MTGRVSTSLKLRALDVRDHLTGRADHLVPPRRLAFRVGHSDFVDTGDELLRHARAAGLEPEHRVLDIGCGLGRFARPLTAFLREPGFYAGFDIDRDAIGWCRRRYHRFPRFHFQVADLYNRRFNPGGRHRADEYRFPYENASFDFAMLASVITHVLPGEAGHYLSEAGRVLAPGGRMLATAFLLDEGSRAGLPFLDSGEEVAVVDDAVPEEAVAYAETWLRGALAEAGLELVEIHPGNWRGGEGDSFQDLMVARVPA